MSTGNRTRSLLALLVTSLAALSLPACEFFLGVDPDTTTLEGSFSGSVPFAEPPDGTPGGTFEAEAIYSVIDLADFIDGLDGETIESVRVDAVSHVISRNQVGLELNRMSVRVGEEDGSYAQAEEFASTEALIPRAQGTQVADVTSQGRAVAAVAMSAGVFGVGVRPSYEVPADFASQERAAESELIVEVTVTIVP